MLKLLQLKDLAIVDEVELEFSDGLTVITGETGTGKSILLDGLDLALGARASRHVVRQGASGARALAVFWPPGGDELVLEREISPEGRSLSRIDGRAAAAADVRRLADGLIELLAQGEAATLLRGRRQRELLDRFAGCAQACADAARLAGRIAALRQELDQTGGDPRQRARQVDLLRHEVEEIDAAHIAPGELAALDRQIDLLASREDVLAALGEVHAAIRPETGPGAEDVLGRALQRLRPFERHDDQIAAVGSLLGDVLALLDEAAASALTVSERLDYDPQALRDAEERRARIESLRRKYGASEEEVLAYREASAKELERLTAWEERAGELAREIAQLEAELGRRREELRQAREAGARRLEDALRPQLEQLALADARVLVHVDDGVDEEGVVRFDFAPNPGEPARPLQQIASGGEASRVLLAVGSLLASDEDATLVLDEVDQGLGGRAARSLSQHLKETSRRRQVIAVSHQAVVAARADRHIGLAKDVIDGRTVVRVEILSGAARVAEIARMLAGEGGDAALRHAEQLLAQS